MTEKDKLRRKVTFGVAPTGFCAVCNSEHFVDELHMLPEVASYTREMSRSLIRDEEPPAPPSEEFLIGKYGYGFMSMFCTSFYGVVTGI